MSAQEREDFVNTYLLDDSTFDMNKDGSSTAISYIYTVPANQHLILGRMMIYLSDGTAFAEELFGGLAALTNGVRISAGGVELDNWKDNMDLVTTMFDLSDAGSIFTKLDKSLSGRWTFHRARGGSEGLLVPSGKTVEALVRDNLSGLTEFRIKIQGVLVDKSSFAKTIE